MSTTSKYDGVIDQAARAHDLDPRLLKTVGMIESTLGANIRRSLPNDPDSPVGFFQMRPSTAASMLGRAPASLNEEADASARYLRQGLDATGSPQGALAYYFAGPDQSGWGQKTAAYVARGQQLYPTMTVTPPAAAKPTAGPSATSDDPDVAAGRELLGAISTAPSKADPDLAAGKALFDQIAASAPPATQSAAEAGIPVTADPYGSAFDGQPPPDAGAVGRIASAAVQGAAQGAGSGSLALSPETADMLARVGVFPPANGDGTILQRVNQGAITAVAPYANALFRGIGGLIGGAQGAVAQAGQEAENTAPGQAMARVGLGPAQLGRDVAAMPEAFPFGLNNGPPRAAEPNRLLGASFPPAADGTPMLLSQELRSNPSLSGNPLVPSMVGASEPNRLLPQDAAPVSVASVDTAGAVMPGMGSPQPGMGAAAQPNSVGAAATPQGAGPAMSAAEALASRTQGERNRFNTPPRGQDSTVYVPGTQPTLAELAADPAVSLQQKLLSQNPSTMGPLNERMQANNDARVQHYEDIAGSAQELNRLRQARDAQADSDLEAAFGNRQPTDPTPALDTIQGILNDPRNSENTALKTYVAPLVDRLYNDDGSLKSDPEVLYGLREDVNRMLSKPALASNPQLAHVGSEVRAIRDALDGVIERGAQGYQQYLTNYANASNPIDAMEFLQEARAGLTNPKGQILPGKFNNLMSNIVEDRATGNPYLPASKLTDDQMNALFNLHADLKRLGNIDLSNPRGSDTNMLRTAATTGARVLSHAVAAKYAPVVGNMAVEMGKNALQNYKANRLLNQTLNPNPSIYPPSTP